MTEFDETLNEHDDDREETEELGLAMFEGDSSTLYPEQRRCLHALLKNRFISEDQHPDHWAVLMENEGTIKGRLNDLFLDLHIDRQLHVAFKRQAVSDSGEALPTILRDTAHTKEETIMMVFLRRRLFAHRQDGDEVVFVDREALLEEVAGQRPEHSTNRSLDQSRASKAIDNLVAASVLLKTRDVDRFRISPIIEVLMPIERLEALWRWFTVENGKDPDTVRKNSGAGNSSDPGKGRSGVGVGRAGSRGARRTGGANADQSLEQGFTLDLEGLE